MNTIGTTPRTSERFVYTLFIESSPDKVWEALTNPEFTKQYWGGNEVSSDCTTSSTTPPTAGSR
jgi:uncharacterized protein YndB with AHSA1/START domain